MTDDRATQVRFWRRWNWWKIGFFAVLLLFEGAREVAVLEANAPPQIATLATVVSTGDLTVAQGRWNRIDRGAPLVPSAVRIECRRDEGRCYEVTVGINDQYVSSPELAIYPAEWQNGGISYENDGAACAHYSVRIDLKLERVFAVRERKDQPSMAGFDCAKLERRLEITTTDGYEPTADPAKGHFLPFLTLLKLVS
jgi:hypothetical protein